MLPEFPKMKNIELSDREDVEKITKKYPPYSDFNFVSMWSWDIKGEMRISQLHGNLVVRFTDYLTGEPFYSFLGDNMVNETAEDLIQISKKEGLNNKLKLVPEISLKNIDKEKFKLEEDVDHFDYILDTGKLKEHSTKKLRYHANLCTRLEEQYQNEISIREIDLKEEKYRYDVISLTHTWIQNKVSQEKHENVSHSETEAIKRFFSMDFKDSLCVGVFYKNRMIGCCLNDLLQDNLALSHFMKGDNGFQGIYSYLFLKNSDALLNKNIKFVNIEQDLGLQNLRQAKRSFEPIDYLKKYSVTI